MCPVPLAMAREREAALDAESLAALGFLRALRGEHTEGFFEVRTIWDAGAAQAFYPVSEPEACAQRVAEIGRRGDTYVGAVPRSTRVGKADTCIPSWFVWADCDGIGSVEALAGWLPPTLAVRSGSGDNLHAWWAL